MLEKQPWIKFAPELYIEWQQCYDEGLDVGDFEKLCRSASQIPDISEETAENISRTMHSRPMRKDFLFEEPSTLPEIQKCRPIKQPELPSFTDRENFSDKIKGAWLGRIAGCLLGKPVEGYRFDRLTSLLKATDNYPINRYILKSDFTDDLIKQLDINADSCWADNIGNIAPVDDDTNYTVFTLKMFETYGPNFTANDVLEARMLWVPYLTVCTAERVSYRNAAMGLLVPECALYKNPYREGVGAQIRGDFYGYINPGNPEQAAALAFRDASTSHVKNGIYGEMFIAAMIAAAAVCNDTETVVNAGLSQIPENCRLSRDIRQVLEWHKSGLSIQQLVKNIYGLYNETTLYGWCHTIPNAMIVTAALLYGERDFGSSICLAVGSAFDTDCNGATVGSIVGIMNGAAAIPDCWFAPFEGKLRTSIDEYNTVDIDMLTSKTMDLIR